MRSPLLHPRILFLPPVFLDSFMGQVLSGPPDSKASPGSGGEGLLLQVVFLWCLRMYSKITSLPSSHFIIRNSSQM
jgi:hypothetical protein